MTVGRQTTSSEYDQLITSVAVQVRNAMRAAANLSQQVNGQGAGLAALEASGYSADDAATALSAIGYLNTPAQLYFGAATQPSAFDFDQELSQYWGGQ
jgi:predicted negative regulator of RcsB-dependent stress response